MNLSKLFQKKSVDFGFVCESTYSQYETAYRNFLDYIHELGGWVVSQYSEEKPPYIKNHIYVIFEYKSPILKDHVWEASHTMTIALPEEIALKISTLKYLP